VETGAGVETAIGLNLTSAWGKGLSVRLAGVWRPTLRGQVETDVGGHVDVW
jgi:hypothetical protein